MALCRVCEKEQHFLDNNCDDDDWDDDWFDIPDDRPEDYPDWDGDESIMYLIDHCFEEDDEDADYEPDEEYECEICGRLLF